MDKLLVTGLAIGAEAGVCQVCNYDLEWLINYPSIFLWADRILVTKYIWGVIQEGVFPYKTLAKCCKLVFDLAKGEGLIEVVEPSPLYDTLRESIENQIETDIAKLQHLFPDKIDFKNLGKDGAEGPRETIIDGVGYCPVHLWTVYACLALSRVWKANCLFSQHVLHYLRYKFGTEAFPNELDNGRLKSFSTIFEAYFPNDPLFPHYAFDGEKKCISCQHEIRCRDTYLLDLEKRFRSLLKLRTYDELQEVKATIDLIIKKRNKDDGFINPNEVATAFRKDQLKLQKNIKSVFPKVKRWASVATIVSIPLAVTGLATQSPLITLAGGSVAGPALTSPPKTVPVVIGVAA
jgi:hypothetical protein